MRKRFLTCFLLLVLLFFSYLTYAEENGKEIKANDIGTIDNGLKNTFPETDVRPPYNWPVSTPEAQSMDSMLIENVYKEIAKMPFVRSFLIVRNGYLVGERYFNGYTSTDAVSFRWAHFIMDALVGIALKENFLHSIDQKMMDFFPEYDNPDLSYVKYEISIKHLLTMKAGFAFEERGEDAWNLFLSSPDWIQYIINILMEVNADVRFYFNSIQPHIISGILTKATGMSTLEFAETYLFAPLGISIRGWEQDPQGIYKGGWGMYFTPRDLARMGHLFLTNGAAEGKQIFTPEWTQESLTLQHLFNQVSITPFDNQDIEHWGYGYCWHKSISRGYDIDFQVGYGGQLIMNFPALNLTLVVTSDTDMTWDKHESNFKDLYYFIIRYIPDLVWSEHEPPPYPPSNINGSRSIVRSLTQQQYLDRVTWEPNPKNADTNITSYRIYSYTDEDDILMWQAPLRVDFIGEVNASTFEYIKRDHIFSSNIPYNTYGITAVSADGKESLPAIVTPREIQ